MLSLFNIFVLISVIIYSPHGIKNLLIAAKDFMIDKDLSKEPTLFTGYEIFMDTVWLMAIIYLFICLS